MPCYRPLQGYRARTTNESGKRSIVFTAKAGHQDLPVAVPCGQCIGCRLERSRQWAMRCVHEATLHDENYFLTLTYDDDHLPEGGTLVKSHHQLFLKRYRKHHKIRFFHCGEYGDENHRPHYHSLIFGHVPGDLVFAEKNHNGDPLYISPFISKLWDKGSHRIGALTFESAAYVARYIVKKVTGEKAEDHYQSVDLETGEIHTIIPEYITMSRRPGIGAGWYDRWKSDVYPADDVIMRGQQMRPPKFYDRQLEVTDPKLLSELKQKRKLNAVQFADNNTTDRLRVRETVKLAQAKQLKRTT